MGKIDDNVKDIIVEGFLIEQEIKAGKLDEYLQTAPLSKETRVEEIMKAVKRGLSFGVEKGAKIEGWKRDRIKAANNKSLEKYATELIFEINESGENQKVKKK